MRICTVFLGLFLISCSGQTNINQFLVPKKQEESFSALKEAAQKSYDSGDFDDARGYAEKAQAISPEDEGINVLLGYIHLSLAGMDPFNIASSMVESGKTSTTSGTSLAESSSGSSATKLLDQIRKLLNLSDDDMDELGERSSAEDLEYFSDYDVYIPNAVSEIRESDIALIKNIGAARSYICSFVDEEVKIEADEVHSSDDCAQVDGTRIDRAKSHFLWAFVHMAEAVAFYSVVFYSESGQTKANLQLRADTLDENKDSAPIGTYVAHAANLGSVGLQVLDATDPDSALNGLLNDLTAVSLAFDQLGSVPPKLRKGLDSALAAIEKSKESVEGGTDDEKQANGLKQQLTKELSKGIQDKITTLAADDPDTFAENQEELCGAYSDLVGGVTLDECN